MEEHEKIVEKAQKATEDTDVEGHVKPKRDDTPTVERERLPHADEDDEPDVEGHVKLKG
jgi:hypothetical protein